MQPQWPVRSRSQGLLSSSVAFLTQCLSFPFYGGQGPTAGDTALPWKIPLRAWENLRPVSFAPKSKDLARPWSLVLP